MSNYVYKATLVPKSLGGFGIDVSTGLTNDQIAIVSANAITIGALTSTAIPSGINAIKISTGIVSNTEFDFLDGVTSSIQTQINLKLDATSNKLNPTPSGAGKLIYDNGTAYVENTAGTTSQVLIGGSAPSFGNVPAAALTSVPAASLTGTVAEANGGYGSNVSGMGIGLVTRTASNTYITRTLTAPSAGITITNPAGTAGNPTLVLANDLAAVEGLSGTGIAVRTTTDTWTNRTIVAGNAGLTITNGDGISGNPSIVVNSAIAVDTGTTNTTGSAVTFSLSDHVHRDVVLQTAGAKVTADQTTASSPITALVDLVGASITITTQAGTKLLINVSYSISNNSALGSQNRIALVIDGVVEPGVNSVFQSPLISNFTQGGSITTLKTGLSAGSHTIKLQWANSAGTTQCRPTTAAPNTEHASITIMEVRL